jgi:DNA-directed RNA polymerase specialized sigma24 family protein
MDNIVFINPEKSKFHSQLIRDYYDRVFQAVKYKMGGNDEQAADITQEVFYEAWLVADILRCHTSVGGWLMKTAKCKVYHYLRDLHKDNSLPSVNPVLFPQLRVSDRRLLRMRYINKRTVSELTENLGVKENTIRKRFSCVLIRLASILTRKGF